MRMPMNSRKGISYDHQIHFLQNEIGISIENRCLGLLMLFDDHIHPQCPRPVLSIKA